MTYRLLIFTLAALYLIGLGSVAIFVYRARKSGKREWAILLAGVGCLLWGSYILVNPPVINEGPGPRERCISEFNKAVLNSKLLVGELGEKATCLNDSVSEIRNDDLLVNNIIDVAIANQSKIDEDYQYLLGTIFISSTDAFAKKLSEQSPSNQKYLCKLVTNSIPDHPIPGDDPRILTLQSICEEGEEH